MKQYRTIERDFYAEEFFSFENPGYAAARHSAEDWIFNEAPRHNAGPVRIVAKVYTESGKCRKIFKVDRNF